MSRFLTYVDTEFARQSRGVLPTVLYYCVWSRNLTNEAALAHFGLLRQRDSCEFSINGYCKTHTLYEDMNKILSLFSTISDRFAWSSLQKISTDLHIVMVHVMQYVSCRSEWYLHAYSENVWCCESTNMCIASRSRSFAALCTLYLVSSILQF